MIKLIKKQLSRLFSTHNVCVICLCFLLYNANAQFYNGSQLSFGKGRVQTHQNIWSYYRTALADIYFYPQGKNLAEYVAKETQILIPEIEKKLKYTLTNKVQIIIYSRHSDYMQSNIGLEVENFYNTGGVTPIYGHKIFLYYNGNMNDFYESLKAGLVGLFINRIVRGNNVLTELTSADLVAIPYWFTDGMSAYFSKAWTAEIDNMIRDGILSGSYRKLHNLPISEQAIAGYSLWNYIAQAYGEKMIINILHYIRTVKNYERITQVTLGIGFDQLKNDWLEYYTKHYLTHPDYYYPENALLKKYKKNTHYLQAKISPDGKNIAYITNQEGKVRVLIYNEETKKSKCIYRFHYRIEENPDYSFPLITWHPNSSILMMIIEKKSKVYMIPYQLEDKKWQEKQIVFVHKVTDFSYSSDGKYITMSAIENGQSDIYIYTIASRSLTPITNDKADDFAPRFINNNTRLVFSSNRNNDTIDKEELSKNYPLGKYDLFVYNLTSKSKILQRITTTSNANEIYATEIDTNYLIFLSDNNGIYNRYLGKFTYEISHIDTGIHYTNKFIDYPITNNDNGFLYQDANIAQQSIIDIVLHKGKYIIEKENISSITSLPEKKLTKTINYLLLSRKKYLQDSLSKKEEVPQRQKRFQFVKLIELQDTSYNRKQTMNSGNSYPNMIGLENMTLIPRVYQTQYYLNSFVVQADFNFLNASYQQFVHSSNPIYLNPGLNLFMMIEAKDLMEDHRLVGGVRFTIDLNKEFIFSYEDFSQRLEKQIAIYYQSIKNINYNGYYESQQNTSLFYILKYPFDRVNSLHFTTSLRYNRYALKATDDISLYQQNMNSFWTEVKAEYVLDFSVPISMNMRKGMRGKAFIEWMCTPDKSFQNMAVVGMDIRHYTKLHRNIVWANRLAASTSFGKNRLLYYMGGLDNWWFAKFNSNIYVDTSINYTYQALATNMRGFEQNIRNGTSFFVLNSELRFSVIQFIMNKPLKNNFLNSLQLIAFGDIGTAWTGISPYSENNSLFKQIIVSGPSIKITLHKQTEPIVAGFGMGLRFLLMGYFLRFDYAWGIENYKINKGIFYASLNLDF